MRSIYVLLTFFSISLLLDAYVYRILYKIKRTKKPSKAQKRAFWGLNLLGYLSLVVLTAIGYDLSDPAFRNIVIGGFGLLFFTKLSLLPFVLFDDVWSMFQWIGRKIGWLEQEVKPNNGGMTRSEFIAKSAILFAAIPFLSLGYGMLKGGYNFQLRKVRLRFPNLPKAFDGVTIVQLSDMHMGSFSDYAAVSRGIDMVNDQKADYFFFTGDLVNNRTDEVNRWMELIGRVEAKSGKFSILGNHDYGDYTQWPDEAAKKSNLAHMHDVHKQVGWKLLLNEHAVLERNGEKIGLIGVENWGARGRFAKYGDLDKALAGTHDLPFKILLSHDPSHFEAQVNGIKTDIDLTLSGHTHGMQFGVEIPGYVKWSPSSWIYPYWAGLYQFGKQYLYVNRGFGFIGYPGRAGIWPEVTHITLERGEPDSATT